MLNKTALFAHSVLWTLLICSLVACNNDTTTTDTAQASTPITETTTPAPTVQTIKKDAENLIEEGDLNARLDNSLDKLLAEYTASAKTIKGFSNPTFKKEGATTLVFGYEENGVTYERHIDLNKLGGDTQSLSVEAEDGQSIKYPSLIVRTANREPVIKVMKDGQQVEKDNEFRITLADRKSIERVAPLMVQIINLAHQVAAK